MTLRQKLLPETKKGVLIMIKGCIPQENITVINIYAPNNWTQTHKAKLIELKRVIDSLTIVGDFDTTFNNR